MYIEINGSNCVVHADFAVRFRNVTVYYDENIKSSRQIYVYDNAKLFCRKSYEPETFESIFDAEDFLQKLIDNKLPPAIETKMCSISNCKANDTTKIIDKTDLSLN